VQGQSFRTGGGKVAVPKVSVAAGLASSCEKVAMLVLERSSRAAPVRTWTLPNWSVLSLSPAKWLRQQMPVPRRRGHDQHKQPYRAKKQGRPKQAWSGAKMTPAGQGCLFATEM